MISDMAWWVILAFATGSVVGCVIGIRTTQRMWRNLHMQVLSNHNEAARHAIQDLQVTVQDLLANNSRLRDRLQQADGVVRQRDEVIEALKAARDAGSGNTCADGSHVV